MSKTLLVNTQHPRLGIFVPELRQFRRFKAGRLEIDSEDPSYATVMATATRRSDVTVVGQVETDDGEIRQGVIKEAAAFACTVCVPTQIFKNAGLLAVHNAQLHTAKPMLDGEGNDQAGVRHGAAMSSRIPAATRKT